ncbi:pentapeptide repeat-containing protein [Campylobacter volucris]|uniref:pentapeptide repeat-containing protein n=1 Tax=Campylobacter volucris TaxID=1031542 RepID=UPI00189F2CEF|nr:pentapeptide repeat-containing protein [Campylobacter volucris]MBF7046081.1 pentapeptide repeat-containing protein [Campylobacter volucris]
MQNHEQIKEEIAQKLDISKNEISYIEHSDLYQITNCAIKKTNIEIFEKYHLFFYNCQIQNFILENPIHFIEFKLCEFKDSFLIRKNFSGSIIIKDSIFYKDFQILWVEKPLHKIYIGQNNFQNVSIFENQFLNFCFEENKVKNTSIYNNIFKENAYFTKNNFERECVFFKNSFEKSLSFYNCIFSQCFVFFQNNIKENLNTTNTNLDFTFDKLQENIYNQNNIHLNSKIEYRANDFRDSFKTFKNALIKDNNLLDASKFHKYELYCKEIELLAKKDKTSKEKIDLLQLVFYRKLCDHHTDLLKVFHNLLIVFMLFGIFSFTLNHFKTPPPQEQTKYNIINTISNETYLIKDANKTTYNFLNFDIRKDFTNLEFFLKNKIFINTFVISALIFLMILMRFDIFVKLFLFSNICFLVFDFLNLSSLFAHILMIILLMAFILTFAMLDENKEKFTRIFVVLCAYICFVFILLTKASLLIPIFGNLLEKNIKGDYPLMLSFSVMYFVFVILVLFSLQKTARKNTIIPK